MPFVQVWVDAADCDCECEGDCKRGKEADVMERQIDAALVAIVQGRPGEVEAILRGDVYLPPRPSTKAQELAYAAFKAQKLGHGAFKSRTVPAAEAQP